MVEPDTATCCLAGAACEGQCNEPILTAVEVVTISGV